MLIVKGLKKKFGDYEVLRGIDLEIKKGDKIAIIGSSGCGKSTFLRCLNMLETPSEGNIIFEGKNILEVGTDLSSVRRKMGMVFQQFNLFPHLTVLENIILAPIKLKVMTRQEAQKKAISLLESIDLKDKADRYPDELSGGQKQRVAIIRTLMMNPEIILFDEPTSALDPEMVWEVLDLIEEIAKNGITMVIVSHEMKFVRRFATKVVFIDEGRVAFAGSTQEVFGNCCNERLKDFLAKTE